MDRGRTVEDDAGDTLALSAVAWMIATASLGTACRPFSVGSVWVVLSTELILRHSLDEEEEDAAAADAVVVVAAVASAAAEDVVARCPKDIFCIASLKRPTGRNQWPLLPFSIWSWMWLPRGRMSQPFSSMNQISPVPHRITAFIFSRLLIPSSAGKAEPLTTAVLK